MHRMSSFKRTTVLGIRGKLIVSRSIEFIINYCIEFITKTLYVSKFYEIYNLKTLADQHGI